MLKKITALICLSLVMAFSPLALAANEGNEIIILLDGENLEFDVSPVIVSDRVMVPMRAIFEALGADVKWDYTTGTVTAVRDDISVTAVIGDNRMQVNDRYAEMPIAPVIVGDRTLVPIRFISEAFGAYVHWEESRQIVYIDSSIDYLHSGVVTESIVEVPALTLPLPAAPEQTEQAQRHPGRLMVMYHANGGVGAPISNTVTIAEDGSVRFRHPFSEPRKEGYTFIGWRFENMDEFEIDEPGRRVIVLDLDPYVNETVTYFAQWERNNE